MMAKAFYSIEEVCERLGKSEAEVKALVGDGELREFRDAGKIFFRAEDVEALAGGGGGGASTGDEITLEPADDALPSLGDPGSGTSIIGLAPVEDDSASRATPPTPPPIPADDPGVGIGVFDDDELEIDADPMAKTQITDAAGDEQLQLEGGKSGSGSGLLDLTREADDTSLGAELLDDIYPGEDDAEEQAASAAPAASASAAAEAPPAEEAELPDDEEGVVVEPVMRSAPVDSGQGIFGGVMAGSVLCLAMGSSVLAAPAGLLPSYAAYLSSNLPIQLGVLAGVILVSTGLGWVLGRAFGR